MSLLSNLPEDPIGEDWVWQTDIIKATDKTEQRIETCEFPKRIFHLKYVIDGEEELRDFVLACAKLSMPYDVVLFCNQTKVTANYTVGDADLKVISLHTELRIGDSAYIFDNAGGEVALVTDITDSAVTFDADLSRNFKAGSRIAPIASLFSTGNVSLSRFNPDQAGSADINLKEVGFLVPFLNEFNETELEVFDGLPVLERRPIGTGFNDSIETGIEAFDFGGVVEFRNPWLHFEKVMPRQFVCNRLGDYEDWNYWKKFADYCKGSCNPFLTSSYRGDFGIVTPAAPGGATITVKGSAYRTDYFPFETYKRIAISTLAGVHYARVSSAIASGSDTVVTFTPVLPTGEGWDQEQLFSLLMQCRINNDMISLQHSSTYTVVAINLRTVDE